MSDKHEQSGGILSELFHGWEEIVLLLAILFSAFGYLSYSADKLLGKDSPWKPWIWIGTLCALTAFYFFNIRPKRKKLRALKLRPTGHVQNDYFSTSPRESDNYQFFATGYERFVEWLKEPKSPLLYLTGASGSGKSSLINAYVVPKLKDRLNGFRTEVSVVRTYQDPLNQLQSVIMQYGVEGNGDVTPASAYAMLKTVSKMLSEGERILIVLDQFEEFFLLRNNAEDSQDSETYQKEIEQLSQFFHLFLSSPLKGITILLSYRDDFQQLIDQLKLPARNEHINFEQLSPLLFYKAKEFLTNCPGMNIPAERLEKVLEEASTVDSPVTIRPIVLNILGIILQQMVDHPTAWKRDTNLIRSFILQGLGKEVKLERATVLKAMLTDFETAKPRSVAELAQVSGLDITSLDNQLLAMSNHGLVRCLDKEETSPDKRKWQIAHDFIATKLEQVVHGLSNSTWRKVRPWVAPVIIMVVMLSTSFIYSGKDERERKAAAENLNAAGFDCIDVTKLLKLRPGSNNLTDSVLQSVIDDMVIWAPDTLIMMNADSITSVNCLGQVGSLIKLDISNCQQIKNINGLVGLTKLKSISLFNCNSIRNIEALSKLVGLEVIDLGIGNSIAELKGGDFFYNRDYGDSILNLSRLQDLTKLKILNLYGRNSKFDFKWIVTASHLEELYITSDSIKNISMICLSKNLQVLVILSSNSIKEVTWLKNHQALTTLVLNDCDNLTDISGIQNLPTLTTLNLRNCGSLTNVSGIRNLPSLITLDLANCDKLMDVSGIHDLPALSVLNLITCNSLNSVSGIKNLPTLNNLDLSSCPNLTDVTGIHDFPALTTLEFYDCDNLSNLYGIKNLPSLTTLVLTNCDNLTNVAGIENLDALSNLELNFCYKFTDIVTLKKMTFLKKVELIRVPLTKNEVQELEKALPTTEILPL